MGHCTEGFVGIEVTKAWNAVAIADGERGGEVRYLGEVDASEESMRRFVKRIAAKHERVHFCYEAGPTGYGLHRVISALSSRLTRHMRAERGCVVTKVAKVGRDGEALLRKVSEG